MEKETPFSDRNVKWMRESLRFAQEALKKGEVPVGCIFVLNEHIIANGTNTVNETKNATRHAEMNCIDDVLELCKRENLDVRETFGKVDVVVTVEPCIMCAGALFELNVNQIVYGCKNYRFGGCSTVLDVPAMYEGSNCRVVGGIFGDEAIDLLKEFYKGTNPNAPPSKVKKKGTELTNQRLDVEEKLSP